MCDLSEIQRAAAVLVTGVTELRALHISTKHNPEPHTAFGFFDNPEDLARAAALLDAARGVYVVLNEVKPELLSRAPNVLRQGESGLSTSDSDVIGRRWLPIDVDPVRPKNVASNEAEHLGALARAREIAAWLGERGWPQPIVADSGNGAHLLYRIDLPVDDGGLVKRCLAAIADAWDDAGQKVDRVVYNPARIFKLYGSISRKGIATAERPHRVSRILSLPEELEEVPLEALAGIGGEPKELTKPTEPRGRDDLPVFDVQAFLDRHGLKARGPEPWQGGRRWVFKVCPWNPDHDNAAAYAVQFANGAVAAGCHHNGCADKTWADLRGMYELREDRREQAKGEKQAVESKGGDDRPAIQYEAGKEHDAVLVCIETLAKSGVYHRVGRLVTVRKPNKDDAGGSIVRSMDVPIIADLSHGALWDLLATRVKWEKWSKTWETWVPSAPARDVCWAVHGLGEWRGLPWLGGVSTIPILRRDGSLWSEPGYDRETGLYYVPSCRVDGGVDRPTRSNAGAALMRLEGVVSDFPFLSEVDRAAWVSTVLSRVAWPAFDGGAPLVIVDANSAGAGKSLLADTSAMISTGGTAARSPYARDEDEMRKRITSHLMAGDQIALVDNVPAGAAVGWSCLDCALTGDVWSDRELGASRMVRVPMDCLWMVTGNNLVASGDTARRALRVRIEADCEKPEERKGFAHDPLLSWVRSERGGLLAACFDLLRAYVLAGMPACGLRPLGSFEGWSGLVRSAMVWAGSADPGDARCTDLEAADPLADAHRALLAAWSLFDDLAGGLTCAQVLGQASRDRALFAGFWDAVGELCPTRGGDDPSAAQLGRVLRGLKGKRREVDGEARYFDGRGGGKDGTHGGTKWVVKNSKWGGM